MRFHFGFFVAFYMSYHNISAKNNNFVKKYMYKMICKYLHIKIDVIR